ncbi:hypothetical protein [Enterococcus mundtii]|uniref:hypothetical protein n=1 Tax=Enterococcus mundtii TaxID=53346 RepID=UPI000DFA00E3|nr:hypothetical protein [Enterococcus mundtii]STE38129.1 Uncharacterised protein [Enterococcus mundtii]
MNRDIVLKVLMALLLIGIIGFEVYQIDEAVQDVQILQQEKESAKKEAIDAKESYEAHKEKLLKELYTRQEQENNSDVVSQVLDHNNSYEKSVTLSEEFFSTFFNWSNSEEYHDRVNKLSDIITTEVKENENIFDKGIDSIGGDYIKTSELKAVFEDKNVSVHYYDVVIDQKKQVITGINRIF